MATDKLADLFIALSAPLNAERDVGVRIGALKAALAAQEHNMQMEYTSMMLRSQMGDVGGVDH
jgi:hypothetical protein